MIIRKLKVNVDIIKIFEIIKNTALQGHVTSSQKILNESQNK